MFERNVKLEKDIANLEQKLAKVKDQTMQATEASSKLKDTIKGSRGTPGRSANSK